MENLLSSLSSSKPIVILSHPNVLVFTSSKGLAPRIILPKFHTLGLGVQPAITEDRSLASAKQLASNLQESRPKLSGLTNPFNSKVNDQNANQVVDFLTDPKRKLFLKNLMRGSNTSTGQNESKKIAEVKRSAGELRASSKQSRSRYEASVAVKVEEDANRWNKNAVTVDEKIEMLLLSRRGSRNEFARLITQEEMAEGLPRKKVKGSPSQIEVSEEDVQGVNALREIMLREKKRQLEQEAFERIEFEQNYTRTSSKSEECQSPSDTESERQQSSSAQEFGEALRSAVKQEELESSVRFGVKIEE